MWDRGMGLTLKAAYDSGKATVAGSFLTAAALCAWK